MLREGAMFADELEKLDHKYSVDHYAVATRIDRGMRVICGRDDEPVSHRKARGGRKLATEARVVKTGKRLH